MALKYHCRKCGKKYVEWGAEKLRFLCPQCDGEELVRVGGSEGAPPKKPSLKRTARKTSVRKARNAKKLDDGVETKLVDGPDELVSTGDADLEIAVDTPLDKKTPPLERDDGNLKKTKKKKK